MNIKDLKSCGECRSKHSEDGSLCWSCFQKKKKKEILSSETRSSDEIRNEINKLREQEMQLSEVLRFVEEKESIEYNREWIENLQENKDKIYALVDDATKKIEQVIAITEMTDRANELLDQIQKAMEDLEPT